MSRINVYARSDESDTVGPKLAGWFDDSGAEWFREDSRWDGNQNVGIMSGIPAGVGYEGLHRTAQGRWVREYNARNYYNGPRSYEFVTDEAAREWLLRNGSDDVVEKYFGPVEDEHGPGKPEIGPATVYAVMRGTQLIELWESRTDAELRAGEVNATFTRGVRAVVLEMTVRKGAAVGKAS